MALGDTAVDREQWRELVALASTAESSSKQLNDEDLTWPGLTTITASQINALAELPSAECCL